MKSGASSEPWIPVLFVVVAILGIALAFALANQVHPAPTTVASADKSASPSPTGPGTGVKFAGTLTADGCSTAKTPVGDVGCSMTIDNSDIVYVMHGDTQTSAPWGSMLGFPASPTSPIGGAVEVYAHQISGKQFTLQGSSSFYVKLAD